MFEGYTIKNNVLYIQININYEFGGDNNKKSFIDQIREYLDKIGIKSKIDKIVLTCSGIMIGSIILLSNGKEISKDNIKYVPEFNNNISTIYKEDIKSKNNIIDTQTNNIISNTTNNTNSENISQNNNISSQNTNNELQENSNNIIENNITEPAVSRNLVTVHKSNGEIINIDLEEYVIGVIAAEMPASFNMEALKAQSVVARTYALKARATGKILTDTVSTQSYIDENGMRNKWGGDFDMYYNKIRNAVNSTNGEYLTYNGEYIEALYHSTNNGKTESSLDVFGNYYPYLISVSSEYDKYASSYLRDINIDFNTLSSKLGLNFNKDSIIQVLSYTDGGNIREISIDGKVFSGRQFRELLGLRSADFDININDGFANITTRGFGHGVGMSQYGANLMANDGYSYVDILYHYYPSVTLQK